MASQYSIVQFVPDLVTDERINVGVIAIDRETVRSRFLRDWARVRGFAGGDLRFLRTFARQVDELGDAQTRIPTDPNALTSQMLEAAPKEWANTIQLTPFRASTLAVDDLVDQISRRFLREHVPKPRSRDRRAAAAIATHHLLDAMKAEGARKPEKYVQRNVKVEGDLEGHDLDVALKNGTLRLGVLGLSFEGRSTADVVKEIGATAWTIDDVKRATDLPMAIVTLPPKGRTKAYDRARHVFEGLGAQVVTESEVEDWAYDAAREAQILGARS